MVNFILQYTAIQVKDLEQSLRFYTDILGMKLTVRAKVQETKGEFAIVRSEGSNHWLEINWYEDTQYRQGDELDHIAFQVENLDEAVSELAAKGTQPVSYTRDMPNSRWTYIQDPNGIWIEIFEKKRPNK